MKKAKAPTVSMIWRGTPGNGWQIGTTGAIISAAQSGTRRVPPRASKNSYTAGRGGAMRNTIDPPIETGSILRPRTTTLGSAAPRTVGDHNRLVTRLKSRQTNQTNQSNCLSLETTSSQSRSYVRSGPITRRGRTRSGRHRS
jgi:hypothetical protein